MAHSRIDDLRRRVEADPASIAFAQLAEEYRRAGQTEEAVRVCREGLTRHPGYLSARVTLGRALLDLGQLDEARAELQFVAGEAPENLAAIRGLAEIFHREGDLPAALEHFQRALTLARHDPELEEIVQQLSRQVGAEAGPSNGLTYEEAHQELLSAAERLPLVAVAEPAAVIAVDTPAPAAAPAAAFSFDSLVAALGTPDAPPLVEAVVSGETPAVFELPDLPASGGDPFAALEAELRAQDVPPGLSIDEQLATIVAPDLTDAQDAEAPLAVASTAAAPTADEWPALVAPEPVTPADPDSPWLSARLSEPDPAPVSDDSPVAPTWAGLESAEATDAGSAGGEEPTSVEPWPEAAPVAPTFDEVPAMAHEEPLAAPDPPVADAVLADVEAELQAHAEAVADAGDSVEHLMATLAVAAPSPESATDHDDASGPAAPAPDETPGAARDDVLGDLEDWLHTLQDRSTQ